jgi:signal transduction histidine kinase
MDFAAPKRPELVSSDVATVISAPIGLLRYHLERRGISIEERYQPMPEADLDAPSIQQVVINIISDMAGAMPRGGRLTISTAPAGDHAQIAVEADAPEVDIEALVGAFQPFDDDPGEIPGSRRIAASLGVLRGHGGTIGLRNEPAGRPRVEIHLPYRGATTVD